MKNPSYICLSTKIIIRTFSGFYDKRRFPSLQESSPSPVRLANIPPRIITQLSLLYAVPAALGVPARVKCLMGTFTFIMGKTENSLSRE